MVQHPADNTLKIYYNIQTMKFYSTAFKPMKFYSTTFKPMKSTAFNQLIFSFIDKCNALALFASKNEVLSHFAVPDYSTLNSHMNTAYIYQVIL